MKLTPTEGRLYYRLMRGSADPDELVALLSDELATRENMRVHLSNLRRKGVCIAFRGGLYHLDSPAELDKAPAVHYDSL